MRAVRRADGGLHRAHRRQQLHPLLRPRPVPQPVAAPEEARAAAEADHEEPEGHRVHQAPGDQRPATTQQPPGQGRRRRRRASSSPASAWSAEGRRGRGGSVQQAGGLEDSPGHYVQVSRAEGRQ